MTKEDLIENLVECLKKLNDVASASRIDGEYAIGVETQDGAEYFIEIVEA